MYTHAYIYLYLKGTSLWFRSPPVRTSPAITLPSTYNDRLINPASCKTYPIDKQEYKLQCLI